MKKFIGYFENKITFELDNYSNHIEDKHTFTIKRTDGTKVIFMRINMKAIYGKDMPMDIIYKCGFIKFERFEIVEVA